jgi:hypothetical protein
MMKSEESMNKDVQARAEEDCPGQVEEANHDRRQLLVLLSAAAGICTMQLPTASAVDATEIAPPRRALTVATRPEGRFFSRLTSRRKL